MTPMLPLPPIPTDMHAPVSLWRLVAITLWSRCSWLRAARPWNGAKKTGVVVAAPFRRRRRRRRQTCETVGRIRQVVKLRIVRDLGAPRNKKDGGGEGSYNYGIDLADDHTFDALKLTSPQEPKSMCARSMVGAAVLDALYFQA